MRKRGRNIRYRRSIYQKNGIRLYILIALGVVVAAVLLFVAIGNSLGNKVEESESKREAAKATDTGAEDHSLPRNVSAYPVPLSADGSRLESRLNDAVSLGYTDICFLLDTEDDTLLYRSDVAVSMGYLSSDASLWRLDDASGLFRERDLYLVGVTHLSRMNTENDLERSIAAGYYTARISEALRAGVDDVLIHPVKMSENIYTEIVKIADEVHRLCPDSTVGISVTPEAVSSENGAELIDLLWNSFDYIAVDVNQEPEEGVTPSESIDRKLGGMLYYLLRYNMRVLVPYSDDAEMTAAIKAAVISNGTENIQIMP